MSYLQNLIKFAKSLLSRKTTGAVVAIVVSFIYFSRGLSKQIPLIKLSYFLTALSQNIITEVLVSGTKIIFRSVGSETWYQTNASLLTKDRLYKLLSKKPNVIFSSVDPDDGTKQNLFTNIAVLGATYFLGYKLFSAYMDKTTGNDAMKKVHTSNTKFTDIYGLPEAKKELQEIINFLKEPAKYKAVGARLRKGVLLYGPSGTGKTLLARAIAGEAKASFLSCAASEFMELYVGVGPKRVRELFARARQIAPCIVFIDEIDGIGLKRKSQFSQMDSGGDTERNSTLNQLLIEMDGFRENQDIVIIAATNRPTILDEALLRSGRFDTKIKINLPDLNDRIGIMKIHLRNKKHQISESALEKIAKETEGYSGADMENIVNECAYVCVQKNRNIIEDSDIQEAFDKIHNQRRLA